MSEAITKAEKWLATHHAEAFKRGDHETLRIVEHLSRLTALQEQPARVEAWLYRYVGPTREKPGSWGVRFSPPADEELQTDFYEFHPLVRSALQPSPAREEAEALVSELRGFAAASAASEAGDGAFMVIERSGYDSEGLARNLRAVLGDAARLITREILGEKP